MSHNPADMAATLLAALCADIGVLQWRSQGTPEHADIRALSLGFAKEHIAPLLQSVPERESFLALLAESGGSEEQLISIARKTHLSEAAPVRTGTRFRQPLLSVLSRVSVNEHHRQHPAYHKPLPLSVTDIFPFDAGSANIDQIPFDPAEMQQLHTSLYTDFIAELATIPAGTAALIADSLLFLMEKYLTRVNAACDATYPDISLYDHCRSIAALAVASGAADQQDSPFILYAADISGIQSFIYDNKKLEFEKGGTAKRLRGKSFYITLLTDTISDYLVRCAGVTRASVLMNGGGHFILLLPNSAAVNAALQDAEVAIQQWFFRAFKGELNLVTASLKADASLYQDYNKWHTDLTFELQRKKKLKSFSILKKVFSGEFKPADFTSFQTQLFDEDRELLKEKCNNDYERYIFHLNNLFEKTGMHIPKSSYLIQWFGSQGTRYPFHLGNRKSVIPFAPLGIWWTFAADDAELTAVIRDIQTIGAEYIRVLRLNDTYTPLQRKSLTAPLSASVPVCFGFRVLGNAAPLSERNELLEYADIAAKDDSGETPAELSYPLLGVLRMDVDNLGAVFGFGLKLPGKGKGIESLSRVVNLSRDLNLFFLGYLNTIARRRNIYITYSGGDDLFVVGSWINCLEFVEDVRTAFSRYTGHNPSLTISGGLYFSKPSFPVYRAAELAGKWLEHAKASTPEKSCIKVFDRVLNWADFADQIAYAKEFDALVGIEGNEAVKPSHLHFLMANIQQLYNEKTGEIRPIEMHQMMSKIKYYLSHSSRKVKHDGLEKAVAGRPDDTGKVNKKVLAYSRILMNTNQQKYLKYFIIPASFVILKHRNLKKVKEHE